MGTKRILGLDLGTNSIGWALINRDGGERLGEILAAGSRIIPMSQDALSNFDKGVSVSQTAERTGFRGTRRLRERHLLRRERLHRVLNILGFLPEHYAAQIDFEKHFGQFLPETEPKLAYSFKVDNNTADFLFKDSFREMLADFTKHQPQLLKDDKKVPYDWTIYYLRKKALKSKIKKEELAWLLLHFNQKRGYYQLRGEDEEETPNKLVEFYSLKVVDVSDSGDKKGKNEIWYNIHLENGWIYRRTSKTPFDWVGKTKDFIVTTDLNDDGSVKKDKEGKEKRSLSAPTGDDWTLIKKKTEHDIDASKKTVGEYIYDTLLQKPNQKIRGKLVRAIERKFYKDELRQILETQQNLHSELQDRNLYRSCLEELYEYNEAHRNSIGQRNFTHLFLDDIIFYQRPLKSKKSLISNCKFENRIYLKDGKTEIVPLKCIAKSHPLFQEFRLLKFIKSLRIYQKEKEIRGKLQADVDVTEEFLPTTEDWTDLFDWLNNRKEIDQKALLKYPAFKLKKNSDNYRWNYSEDKLYPCNETRSLILSRINKLKNEPTDILTPQIEEELWHILYSVEDKIDIEKALKTFADRKNLSEGFKEQFKKFPRFKKDYGSYSAKAIKKLLPLMRMGKYWSENNIQPQTKDRILKIITGEYDETIRDRVRDKSLNLTEINHFQGLPEWLASYIAYNRHAEDASSIKWKTPNDIKLLQQYSLRNPVVEQVINETLQVVKDIWKQHGNSKENFFDEIHIELGREMKNTKADREKIAKQVSENENTNLRIKALLTEMLNDPEIENIRPFSPTQQEILKIYEEGALNSENEKIPEEILKISKQAQPTQTELTRYKLWLQQKYRSPYTGNIIPLNKLFSPAYEIEHIIPQSRHFDDSFSNKIICESEVNKLKDNSTAFEFILKEGGRILETGLGTTAKIFGQDDYEKFVKENYAKNRSKMKKLLMEDIPEAFIHRQLNDTRYISKVVKNLMSNVVREEDEQEVVSRNIVVSNGTITATLKQDWGLNDIWNEIITPRFERLNELTQTRCFGEWTNKGGKRIFQTQVPLHLQKGFSKKRIDHRHHALDAIVTACVSRDHINYLNNESGLGKNSREEKAKKRYDLRHKLSFKKYNDNTNQSYKWIFHKPWDTFVMDSKEILHKIAVSYKQNLRVINKTVNRYQKWEKDTSGIMVKHLAKQTKGDSWAVRKPMHKATVWGLVRLKIKKIVTLSSALEDWKMIADKALRKHIKELIAQNRDKRNLLSYFKERENKWADRDISKVEIYHWDIDKSGKGNNVATRVKIGEDFNTFAIKSITDSGIQKILLEHLEKYNENGADKIIEHPELAFSPDGLDELNKNIKILNGNKEHQPILKARTYESRGNKFNIGHTGNKKDKYAETAQGTNLFFAIYQGENGRRQYATIPLNIVIEQQKDGLLSVPETNELGNKLLMHLSPNDLVYLPTDEERSNIRSINFNNLNAAQVNRIYKFIDSSETTANFIPSNVSTLIFNESKKDQEKSGIKYPIQNEFGLGSPQSKNQKSLDDVMIKELCIKLKVDRLGNVKPIISNRIYSDTNTMENKTHEPLVVYGNKKSIQTFSSFDEMENDQLKYFAVLSPEESLKNLKKMVLTAFGLKNELLFNTMPRVINFKREE